VLGRRRFRGLAAAAVLVGASAVVLAGTPVSAATFTPASTTDSATPGSNSLRDIIQNQATNVGGDEVDLVSGAMYTLDVCPPTPGGGSLAHGNTPLIISTPSGAPATINQTCSGQGVLLQGVFLILGEAPITLNNVRITGGNAVGPFGGGAILGAGDVTVANSTIINNSATGGRLVSGGAILGGGNVVVANSTLADNSVTSSVFAMGGAITGVGDVAVTNSTLTSNTVSASRTASGGAIDAEGNLKVTNSTITNNSSTAQDGGIGAVTTTLAYTTLVGNSAPVGANLEGGLTSFGSVVALPLGGGENCGTPFPMSTAVHNAVATTSNGFNFSDDASCGFATNTDRQSAGDPGLGSPASNGGPTQTRLPLTGSPLIDAIPNSACQTPPDAAGITTDQRLLGRPSPSDGACDTGAVEIQVGAPAPTAIVTTPRFAG
jgi:hypothetical protein